MVQLTNSIIIDAPADSVWEVVAGQFDRIGEWATAIPASVASPVALPATDAPVHGRVCRTGIAMVPEVTETIVAFDAATRTLTYQATAGMPNFVTDARNRWQVVPLNSRRCRVTYTGEMRVRGLLGHLARWLMLLRVNRTGRHLLDDLKHYAERGGPSARKQRQLGRAPQPIAIDPVASVGTWPTTRRLRTALRCNAGFSLLSGLLLVSVGWLVATPWGLGPVWLPPAVGAAVAGIGVLVARLAVEPGRRLRRGTPFVVAADLAWVAGSVTVLAIQPLPAPSAIAVTGAAGVVAALAVAQILGLVLIRPDDPLSDVEIVEAARVFIAQPEAVWPLLTDHDLYGRLAPNLVKVELISVAEEPLRRRCTNTSGQEWEETCTLWQDGRRFAFTVDTRHYPLPILSMQGLWQVDAHPAGSKVTMRFAYQPEPTLYGGLLAIGPCRCTRRRRASCTPTPTASRAGPPTRTAPGSSSSSPWAPRVRR